MILTAMIVVTNFYRSVADKLVAMSRDSDIVARFAGDEFVVILPETDAQNAATLITRFQDELNSPPLSTERSQRPNLHQLRHRVH